MPFKVTKYCSLGLIISGLAIVQVGRSQNYTLSNSWQVNPYLVNPASAASDYTLAYSTYRAQWLGMPGAPKFTSLGFNTLMNKTRVGLGFKFSNFTRGFLSTNDISATFAYGVPINKTNKVFFGLSGGMLMQSINWGRVTDDSDPVLTTLNKSAIPSLSFGVLLKNSSGFNLGVTMPQLARSEQLNATFQFVPENLVVMAYYSTWAPQGGVKSHNRSRSAAKRKKDGNPLELYSLYRLTQNGGQAEVFAKFNTKAAWLSMGYRQGMGIIPGVGFNLGKVNLQYTYETGIGGDIPLKSHEFILLAKFGDKKLFKGDPGTKPKPSTNPPSRGPRLPSNDPSISSVPKNKGKSNPTTTASTTKPTTSKPATTKPGTVPSTNNENNTSTSGNTPRNRPNDNGLSDTTTPPVVEEIKPVETTPTETKPAETKPTDTKPVVTQTKPAETKPVETKPVVTQTKPAETKPVETKPVVTQTKPAETKPVETKPVVTETKPVETKPVVTETKPAETKPVVTETKPVVTETKPVETKPVVTETKPAEKKTVTAGEVVQLTEEEQAKHEEDLINRLDDHTDNPLEEHAGEEHEHAERHEFWTRGNHEKELEIGHYVIVGVFKSEANAKRVSDGYRNLGFKEVDYGFQSGKGFWFVHIAGSEDMDVPDATKLRNKYRKMKMFKDAWLLTVHQ